MKLIRIIKGKKHNKSFKPGGLGEIVQLSFCKVALMIKVCGLKSSFSVSMKTKRCSPNGAENEQTPEQKSLCFRGGDFKRGYHIN